MDVVSAVLVEFVSCDEQLEPSSNELFEEGMDGFLGCVATGIGEKDSFTMDTKRHGTHCGVFKRV